MLLTIDIGNTNLTLGLYEAQKLGAHWRLSTDHDRMPDEFGIQILGLLQHSGCSPSQLDGICIASVVPPLTGRLVQACRQYLECDPMIISHQMNSGITILYDDPSTVGADRIADAVATYKLYGGPACIVDFGTATTFNALTEKGEYLGGAITAGVGVAAEALVQRTSKLLRVDLVRPPNVIGRNTTHALQSGLLYGYAALTEGMVARFRTELGEKMKVIATGGLAELIAPETNVIQYVNPWLTLEGIRMLWEMNG